MHKALYHSLDAKFSTNADTLTAHRWTMNVYILWKRCQSLRDGMNKEVSGLVEGPSDEAKTRRSFGLTRGHERARREHQCHGGHLG